MSEIQYVPILKWKKGERLALENLTKSHKQEISPLLELVNDDEETKIIDTFVAHLQHYPLYIDTRYLENEDNDLLFSLINTDISAEHNIYPVLYPDDFPEYANKFVGITDKVLVRIPVPEDIDSEGYDAIFSEISEWEEVNSIDIDLLLDLGLITEKATASLQYQEVKQLFRAYITKYNIFKSIIIASNSFPEKMDNLSAGEDLFVNRYEMKIFKKIANNQEFESLQEKLIYSDYGVTKYTDTELDFSRLKYGPLPKARYTLENKYWILKGSKNRKTNQWTRGAKSLAEDIYNSEHYYGEHFSFGDLEIKERALNQNNKGPGNSTNWVTIAANHHIAVVLGQLSTLGEI
ncbi:hypothetical protein QW71_13015 [Paenibacillus sp. IHB B 3415]|uniref:beta family protein n=1 Tax=Paenibacillus sp. IHB B 3415 TaxID=867080 RepID=UPI000574C01C|nr:hypothetical protein [Paenibacillus sp. IHB B 3415]KHL95377.1 hypothetical protein QW71_13015 [Paenibacillus sp. IHB B 3415]